MAFVKVCSVSDVPAGMAQVFEAGDEDVVICNVEGEFYAIQDLCTHDQGPLGEGELIGFDIECPRHMATFDVRTGEVTALPAVLGVATYPVRIEGDTIEVDPDNPTEPEF